MVKWPDMVTILREIPKLLPRWAVGRDRSYMPKRAHRTAPDRLARELLDVITVEQKMEKAQMTCNGVNCGRSSFTLPLFLTGLGTGIALTLLLAPLSGVATRSLIARKANRGKNWVRSKATEAENYMQAQGAELRDRVQEVAEVIGR